MISYIDVYVPAPDRAAISHMCVYVHVLAGIRRHSITDDVDVHAVCVLNADSRAAGKARSWVHVR